MGGTMYSEAGRGNFDYSLSALSHQGMTFDPRNASLDAKMRSFPANQQIGPLSGSSKPAHFLRPQDRAISDSSASQAYTNSLPKRDDSISESSSFTPEDVASIFSAITDRLDPNDCKNKDDIKLAIQTSALSLLGSNKSKKRSFTDSPSRDPANNPGKLFPCRYCNKKKKTQCELKYGPQVWNWSLR